MIRTQIQLTEEQAKRLKDAAAREGVSVAELIRRSVDEHLARVSGDDRWERARSIIGKFRSGSTDALGRDHDKYLEEAYDERLPRAGVEERRGRTRKAVGGFRSGKRDIAVRHDDYLDDAYSV
ncbi:MAG: ribbon-helix-helix protein, CopG family [Chloroflexi bacterium]|nr:ribbon-helix-helix protein, CopG family [Chloroflexota bacterium]